jgi:hypothetical protein
MVQPMAIFFVIELIKTVVTGWISESLVELVYIKRIYNPYILGLNMFLVPTKL